MSEKPVVQIMPAENGFVVQVQFNGLVQSFVANNEAEMLAVVVGAYADSDSVASALKTSADKPDPKEDTDIEVDSADAEAEANSAEEAKKEAAAEKKAAAAAKRKAAAAERKAADAAKEAEKSEKTYTADDLRKLMVKAGKATSGPDVVAVFSPFGYKNVNDVENYGPDDIADICAALEELIAGVKSA